MGGREVFTVVVIRERQDPWRRWVMDVGEIVCEGLLWLRVRAVSGLLRT